MNTNEKEIYKKIQIICPKCSKKDFLKVPEKIIDQSKQLTTVSLPAGLICQHSFQAFVDKNLKVRGYQTVDFEFSKLEYLEEDVSSISSLPFFNDILKLLRKSVDDKDILGSALFTIEGKVLYTSLPQNMLFNTIREFEIRDKQKLTRIKKMYLELENNQKVCSQYIELKDIKDTKFILVLFFSDKVKLGMGNLILKDLAQEIELLI
jgi:hypothetical protein